jgi:MFS superfamily sulfate permease-like transporter
MFFVSVAIAGLLQILLGTFRLGGFTHLIPSSVIKGMLTAIGFLLIVKQVPLIIGYDKPDFFTDGIFNLFTLRHGFEGTGAIWKQLSGGSVLIAGVCLLLLWLWEKKIARHISFLPASIVVVVIGTLIAAVLGKWIPELSLKPTQFVVIPFDGMGQLHYPDFSSVLINRAVWETAVIICIVASLETLLSIEAVDKLDPHKRVTPQNRELIAQGVGNFISGVIGGMPVTSVIVRSAANVEAGAASRASSFLHGILLLITMLFAAVVVNHIPYAALAVILLRTGYKLASPAVIVGVYRQGTEQFLPFAVTFMSILFTDLLIGVAIGIGFSVYFLIRHTYRAGFTMRTKMEGHTMRYEIDLALNVSFLNKRRILEQLDKIPPYSIVEIDGEQSVYIDHDVLEIFDAFKTKAADRHIQLVMRMAPGF